MAKQKRMGARKTQILKAAEHIFAKKGFHQATISEVAKEAGVSDATIYEYFPNKEEMLFSIPFEASQKATVNMPAHLGFIRGAANKLRAIIFSYLDFYENNLDHASVAIMILKTNREFLKTEAYQVFRKASRLILEVVKEGIASGEFKAKTDPYLVRAVVLGTIEHSVISRLMLGRPENLVTLVDPLTDMLDLGIGKSGLPKGWNFRISLEPMADDDPQAF